MSQSVDVLAVLDNAINSAPVGGYREERVKAREAVAELIKAAESAYYLGLMVGEDCTWMLAKLQRDGVYKPSCSDGKPSRADAGKDLEKIQACRSEIREAIAGCGGFK